MPSPSKNRWTSSLSRSRAAVRASVPARGIGSVDGLGPGCGDEKVDPVAAGHLMRSGPGVPPVPRTSADLSCTRRDPGRRSGLPRRLRTLTFHADRATCLVANPAMRTLPFTVRSSCRRCSGISSVRHQGSRGRARLRRRDGRGRQQCSRPRSGAGRSPRRCSLQVRRISPGTFSAPITMRSFSFS